ncbi:MAG: hypothetical protein K2N25_08640 [Muribaculaceae bacterium]|nr:hypothetical protein [Muribaculaceae bacterium]
MKRFFNITLLYVMLSIIGSITLMSCRDDLLYDNSVIGEGETNVAATLTFNPMEVGLDTRSSGTAINSFENVCVVVYTSDGKFFKKFMASEESDYDYQKNGNTSYPSDSPSGHPGDDPDSSYDHTSQASTPKASFTFKNLPYGKYRIYAVGNLGMLPDDVTESEVALKSYRVKWESNVLLDNSMFGFFTLDNEKRSVGFAAPDVVINKPGIKLHCWMKRTASKVTIAFDPSGLKEAVTVYIRSVTIHDIPKECTLGEDNTPNSDEDLIKDGETFYYGDGEQNASTYTGWLRLQKGSGIKEAKDHLETDRALYFYENMQGNYEGQKDFLKQQIKEETGTSINEPEKDDDGNIVTNDNGNMKTDFKDRIAYGTYIEVEGYYVSQNSEKLSKGPIKYRFMLGQNTTYNYNAQRNCHYKLTLKFRGWANQPDWHIVYDEIEPSIIVPDPYYISYLYNQNMSYPVRLTGINYIRENNLHLHAQIIKNNWIPTIEKTGNLAPSVSGAYNNLDGFVWNLWAYQNTYAGANYAGFLSLRENKQVIVGQDQQYGPDGNTYLQNNYEGKINVTPRYYADYDIMEDGTGFGISGNASDGLYDVVATDDKSITVNLPMFTRPKELIPASDFSGNNPFYAYVREATVRFSLRKDGAPDPQISTASGWLDDDYNVLFKIKDENGQEKEVKYVDVTIYQVPRIVNPKAIWRRADNDTEFHVELMQLDAAGGSTFGTFKSEGPWRVSILQDPDGLIKLYSDDGQEVSNSTIAAGGKRYIEGVTGTEVDFWYQPTGKIGSNEARCGIIEVEYHDYTCKHLIFVRQGYDKGMKLGQATWSCYNAFAAGSNSTTQRQDIESTDVVVTNSPLSIGSMFKKGNYNYAIRESNNDTYGWLQPITSTTNNLATAYVNGTGFGTRNSRWNEITAWPWQVNPPTGNRTGPENETITQDIAWAENWRAVNKGNVQLSLPSYEDYASLRDNCNYGYGIVYADGATGVADNLDDAHGYIDYNNTAPESPKGVRACIVYNENNGDQVMFPIGAIGQGRRSIIMWTYNNIAGYNNPTLTDMVPYTGTATGNASSNANYYGSLTYSGIGGLLYRTNSTRNDCRPLTYNLYREPGAVYWFRRAYRKPWSSTIGTDNRVASWDINYYTLVFNAYDYGSLGTYNQTNVATQSDALPIKFIYK